MTSHRRIVLLDICFIFATIAFWFRYSFHNWKCENTSFVDLTVVIFIDLTKEHLTIGLSHRCKSFFKLYPFTLIMQIDFFDKY